MQRIGLDCDFQNLDKDDAYWSEIEDAVGEYLVLNCFDEDYKPNEEGLLCESILDKIP